jgi:hypothetical protein
MPSFFLDECIDDQFLNTLVELQSGDIDSTQNFNYGDLKSVVQRLVACQVKRLALKHLSKHKQQFKTLASLRNKIDYLLNECDTGNRLESGKATERVFRMLLQSEERLLRLKEKRLREILQISREDGDVYQQLWNDVQEAWRVIQASMQQKVSKLCSCEGWMLALRFRSGFSVEVQQGCKYFSLPRFVRRPCEFWGG